MGTSLKKVGTSNKVGIACCTAGAIASLIWVPGWFCVILTAACVAGGVYFFKNLLKDYAGSGKRF